MKYNNYAAPKVVLPLSFRIGFGLFMILVFGFVGLMLLFNWFNVIYDPNWNWLRWVGGPIFILYGIFRGYRLFKSTKPEDEYVEDDEDEGKIYTGDTLSKTRNFTTEK